MVLVLIGIAVFLIVRGLIVGLGNVFIEKAGLEDEPKAPTFIVHNHIQENHLHISKEDLKSIIDK